MLLVALCYAWPLAHTLQPEEGMKPWDVFRHSFTLALSKGYLRTTDTLRNKLMVSEWELGRRPIALQM